MAKSILTAVFLLFTILMNSHHISGQSANDCPTPADPPQSGMDDIGPITINAYSGPCETSTTPPAGNYTRPDLSPIESEVQDLSGRVSQLLTYLNVITLRGGVRGGNTGGGNTGDDTSQEPDPSAEPRFIDCEDIRDNGTDQAGVYTIWPRGAPSAFDVFCDFRGRSVVYTVIQSRTNGSLDFQQPWVNYKNGFGVVEPYGNFWLGLDRIHYLTRQAQYRLHIDLVDFEFNVRYAEYESFSLGAENEKYLSNIYFFDPQSTVDDTFSTYHNLLPFSTYDSDNDFLAGTNCAAVHGGGWWYRDCDNVNLNGKYTVMPDLTGRDENGIEFDGFRQLYSLAATSMGLRRNFQPNTNFNF